MAVQHDDWFAVAMSLVLKCGMVIALVRVVASVCPVLSGMSVCAWEYACVSYCSVCVRCAYVHRAHVQQVNDVILEFRIRVHIE